MHTPFTVYVERDFVRGTILSLFTIDNIILNAYSNGYFDRYIVMGTLTDELYNLQLAGN